MNIYKKIIIIFFHSLAGWMLCAAVMGIGISFLKLNTALIVHLFAAPIIFISISLLYFKKFNYTKPIVTALIFMLFIIFMDFFVVAIMIQKSFNMFKSLIGTWIPFLFIFLSTFITGLFLRSKGN